MRVGEVVELVVEKGVFRGRGLARHAGRVVLLSNGYPGERWRARVREVARDFALAEGEQLLDDVGVRRPSPCPHFPECGGCAHQDLTYEAQLRLKRGVVEDALARAGLRWPGEIAVVPSPESGWRTRASLHLARAHGTTRLGFTESGSHRVVDVVRCLQLSGEANGALTALKRAFETRPSLAARVRRVELAESGDAQRRGAVLEGELRPQDASAARGVLSELSALDGLGALVGAGARRRLLTVGGPLELEAHVRGVTLRAHVLSFFQANRHLLEPLVEEVGRAVGEGGTLIDLYGGVGLFALGLGARFERVVCVEGDAYAVADAQQNVRSHGATHVRVVAGDVARRLTTLPRSADERLILDPPRSGAGANVTRAILERRPGRIVFVSCDPPTLARDLRPLIAAGYRIDGVTVLDMFPATFHVETVVRLERTP